VLQPHRHRRRAAPGGGYRPHRALGRPGRADEPQGPRAVQGSRQGRSRSPSRSRGLSAAGRASFAPPPHQPAHPASMSADERRVLLGRIVGVSGVQGWVKLESWTDPRTRIFDYRPWTLVRDGREQVLTPLDGRAQGKGIVARLPGVEDRDQALAMVGSEIHVPRSALPPTAPGEYYWSDLEGLEVLTLDGTPLGRVA